MASLIAAVLNELNPEGRVKVEVVSSGGLPCM